MVVFEKAILEISPRWRCIQTRPAQFAGRGKNGAVYLGVPPDTKAGRDTLAVLPAMTSEFHFYLGSQAVDLVRAFVTSDWANQVEVLSLGNSSYDYHEDGRGRGLDFREMVSVICQGRFEELKILNLGVWNLFHNAHCMYGRLGDVSRLLDAMPNLQHLRLFGQFELTRPWMNEKLETFSVQLSDPVTFNHDYVLSQETVDHLFSSQLTNLGEVVLDLEAGDEDERYTLPDVLLGGETLPRLQKFEFYGFLKTNQLQRLHQSRLASRLGKGLIYEKPVN